MTYSGILCGALAPELQHATVKYFSPNFLEQKVFHVKKGDKYSVFQGNEYLQFKTDVCFKIGIPLCHLKSKNIGEG